MVPYDVEDAAGNNAITVEREISVVEFDSTDVQAECNQLNAHNQDSKVQRAVENALREKDEKHQAEMEKKIQEAVEEERSRHGLDRSRSAETCPDCPKCDCGSRMTRKQCEAACNAREKSCEIHKESILVRTVMWLEGIMPYQNVVLVAFVIAGMFGLVVLQWFASALFSTSSGRTYVASEEQERLMQANVTNFNTHNMSPLNGTRQPPYSAPHAPRDGLFQQRSPNASYGLNSSFVSDEAPLHSPPTNTAVQQQRQIFDDIYASPSPITPRRRQKNGFSSPFQ